MVDKRKIESTSLDAFQPAPLTVMSRINIPYLSATMEKCSDM
jgi:hypothetical protein